MTILWAVVGGVAVLAIARYLTWLSQRPAKPEMRHADCPVSRPEGALQHQPGGP